MYEVAVLKLNTRIAKQFVSDLPKPVSFVGQLGHLINVTQVGDTYEYDYERGFVIIAPAEAPVEPEVEPYVVVILDLDEGEVFSVYGPYTDEDQARATAEHLLEGVKDDDPHTSYTYSVQPVVNTGGRG